MLFSMKKNRTSLRKDVCHFFSVVDLKKLLTTGLFILMILLSPIFLKAQTVKELGALISEMKQSDDASVQAQADRLSSLANDLNPTVYVKPGSIKAYGGNPVCAIVDGAAIAQLYTPNDYFASVELLTVIVEPGGLAAPLDLSALQNFPNLKYVRIVCRYQLSAQQAAAMVTGSNDALAVCYLVAIPG